MITSLRFEAERTNSWSEELLHESNECSSNQQSHDMKKGVTANTNGRCHYQNGVEDLWDKYSEVGPTATATIKMILANMAGTNSTRCRLLFRAFTARVIQVVGRATLGRQFYKSNSQRLQLWNICRICRCFKRQQLTPSSTTITRVRVLAYTLLM